MRCGLLGRKLGHSYSPMLHRLLADYSYELLEAEPEDLERLVLHSGMDGLNVTIPYKTAVLPLCDTLSEDARRTGSVNTLVYRDGRIIGHNTDLQGFLMLACRAGIRFAGRKVLILGSGGTSRTVRCAVRDEGAAEIVVISRSGENHYGNLFLHYDAQVIVNTTPVGMFPDNESKPLSPAPFRRCEGVLDVVYNPLRTALVLEAKALGIPAAGGLAMLAEQAAAAAACFTGRAVPDRKAEAAHITLRRAAENIVLVGMPGCGKSSVGRAVAELLGREFIDTDALAERAAGLGIPEIFAKHGEAYFRRLEREAVRQAGKTGGKVIATGGGVVLDPYNYAPLAQNGRIYFLQRALDRLPTEGRPLSRDLVKLYDKRLPLYRRFANAEIPDGLTVTEAALAVRDRFYADTAHQQAD